MEKEKATKASSGECLEKLERIMSRLRGEGGCPWDRRQTHLSLRPYLLEEAYEVLEAIESGSSGDLREELGDLLLQVVFHAQIAAEAGEFDLADVIRAVSEKMIRRHPHVFADTVVDGVEGVLDNWEKIKSAEKERAPNSVLDGIPGDLPALMQAEKIQKKAARVGFDWPDIRGPLTKISEETRELHKAWISWKKDQSREDRKLSLEEEYGDLLFALVNLARFLEIHPELALHRTVEKFRRRFQQMEQAAAAKGQKLSAMTLEEMDHLWKLSKTSE